MKKRIKWKQKVKKNNIKWKQKIKKIIIKQQKKGIRKTIIHNEKIKFLDKSYIRKA